MDDYAKEYTATQVNNFLDGKQDADDYIDSLERIPKEVVTTVVTVHKEVKGGQDSDIVEPTHKAVGGPVDAGRAYLVGEQGPEIIVPEARGTVLTASETQRAMASPAQLGALTGGNSYMQQTILNVDARGSSLSMADVTMAVQTGLRAEGRDADVRVRTGAW